MGWHSKNCDRKALLRLIKKDGWYPIRQKGGHVQFKHPFKPGKVTIPYHISKNIENSVLKQAQIRKREYGN